LVDLIDVDAFHPEAHKLRAINKADVVALSDYRAISGRFPVSVLSRLTSEPAVATVLQEPRARVLSHYAWWRLVSRGDREIWRDPHRDLALGPLDELVADLGLGRPPTTSVFTMLLAGDRRIRSRNSSLPSRSMTLPSKRSLRWTGLDSSGILELGDNWTGPSRFFEVPLSPMRLNICPPRTAS
jgi:hypothetical protein